MTALQFCRAEADSWSASGDGCSFVISFESPPRTGAHGWLASWRPHHLGNLAIKVGGSPFATFAKAEAACNAILGDLSASHEARRG
jgi:hypothetical protein